ncbi:PREDICTED: transmembrane protein 177 [Nicrophorus vespilloides]|uniref:Transmembrane protein 177 n=1 Tax=Nicrophorus vespilloides TaxID=110193 RepID=A0ABM1M178_NICVS|nr:PREDICTED: transmembrane protein 177 [Nicrophorus vespilloides]
MSYKKVGSLFLTEKGKTVSLWFMGSIGVGAFCAQYIPHTLLINKYVDVIHLYKNGIAVTLNSKLVERFNKALVYADVPDQDVKLYKPFAIFGFDISHVGMSFSKYGCQVGIPVNFNYVSADTVDKSTIKIKGESVAWSTDEAEQFLDSVVLSENAQIYAMAREIKMSQTFKLIVDAICGPLSVFVAYGSSVFLNGKFNLYPKPMGVRLVMYALVGTFTFGNYLFIKDFNQLYYESYVDKELKAKDPRLVEGAKEFYEKILRRNQALRTLMGSEGEDFYTVHGNENYSFRQRHLPLVQRLDFFKEKAQTEELN